MQPSRLLLGARKLVAITSKRGNKNFYKGRGAPPTGEHTSRGGYRVDEARIQSYTFIAPDLKDFKLMAYVSTLTRRSPPKRRALLAQADKAEREAARIARTAAAEGRTTPEADVTTH